MKKRFTAVSLLFTLFYVQNSHAQFAVGTSGLTIKDETTLFIDSLVLTPSADLQIADNALTISYVPVPGNPQSIKRVYKFDTGFSFVGTLGLFYQSNEIGLNIENSLQIAHSSGSAYTVTSGSTRNITDGYISNTVSDITLKSLTAATEGALPVSLATFAVAREGSAAVISWSTTSESGSDYFDVERSIDVKNWQTAGRVNAAGDSRTHLPYHYIDTQLPLNSIIYYRLKMTDKNGSAAYSVVRSLLMGKDEQPFHVFLFPNPSPDKIQLNWPGKEQPVSTEITTISGKNILRFSGGGPATGIELKNLPAGLYVLRITDQNGRLYYSKFAKN